jgi:hypothetical protein
MFVNNYFEAYVSPVDKEKKVQLNCWVSPATKTALEIAAEKDNRRPGNLGGSLLEWAIREFPAVGSVAELNKINLQELLANKVSNFQDTLRSESNSTSPQPGADAPSAEIKKKMEKIGAQVGAHAVKKAQLEKTIHARTTKKLTHTE